MSVTSERAIIIDFLEMYRDFYCLWDISSKQYSNRDARNTALQTLLEKYREIESDATIATIKRKLDNMRTAYKRELKKVEESKTSGAGAGDIYIPTLWYFEYLTFLDHKETLNRSGVDSLDNCDDEVSEKKSSENEAINKSRAALIRKRQENLITTAEKLLKVEETAAEAYGRSTGLQLKEMSNTQRCIAEKLISEIVFYGKMEKLTFQTSININNNHMHDYAGPSPSPNSSTSVRFSPITTQPSIYSPMPSTAIPNIITIRAPEPQQNINTSLEEVQPSTFIATSKYNLEDYIVFNL